MVPSFSFIRHYWGSITHWIVQYLISQNVGSQAHKRLWIIIKTNRKWNMGRVIKRWNLRSGEAKFLELVLFWDRGDWKDWSTNAGHSRRYFQVFRWQIHMCQLIYMFYIRRQSLKGNEWKKYVKNSMAQFFNIKCQKLVSPYTCWWSSSLSFEVV